MIKNLLQEFKKKLIEEKKILEKELKEFADEDTKPKGDWDTRYPKFDSGGLEEEADEVQEYEKLLSIEYSLELRLRDVNSALEKINFSIEPKINTKQDQNIEKREYGKCEKCDKKISIERLKVCPEAKLCMKCK